MIDKAAKRRTRALAALTLAALSFCALPVTAEPLAGHAAPCPQFGPGFVVVAGTSTCVRISGQMRIEYSFGSSSGMGGMDDSSVTGSLAPLPLAQRQIADPAPPYRRLRPVGMKSTKLRMRQQRKSTRRRHEPDAQ